MRKALLLISVLACVMPAAKTKKSSPAVDTKSGLDKATLETYFRHLEAWGPQIGIQIGDPKPSSLPGFLEVNVHAFVGNESQDEVVYVSKDGQTIVRGRMMVYNVLQNPFKADLEKLKTDATPSFGTPGAPVTVVVFSDFQCPYCKEEAKVLRDNIVKTFPTQVQVYFKDLPLNDHNWAKPAAIAGRCLFRQNPTAFWAYHDWIFEHQNEMNPGNLKSKIMEFAKTKDKEIDGLQLDRCIDGKATEAEVNQSMAEAAALKVTSTPSLFVNGRLRPGALPWPLLQRVLEYEVEYQKTHGSNESCCEVKPSKLSTGTTQN